MKVKDLVYCALGACLIAVAAQITITLPITIVPVTLQTFMIYLLGLIYAPKKAMLTAVIYLILGAVGLPVFAGMSGGFTALVSPSGGYLLSYPLMIAVISLLTKQKYLGMILGTMVCYGIGTIWFMFITKMDLMASLTMCVIPFLLGDTLKIVIAGTIVKKLNFHIS